MSDSHDHEDAHDHGHDHGDDHRHEPDGHGDSHETGGTNAHDDHEHHSHDVEHLGYAVVTVSSSRGHEDDAAGDAIESAVEAAGDEVVVREVIDDDFDGVQGTVDRLVDRDDVDCVVTTGGTGVTPDDVTVEAVTPLLDKELPGFGELFRSMSRDEIGTMVVGTRTTAGVAGGVPVFCLPGSENAARLGSEEIIVEEAGHLAGLAGRE